MQNNLLFVSNCAIDVQEMFDNLNPDSGVTREQQMKEIIDDLKSNTQKVSGLTSAVNSN